MVIPILKGGYSPYLFLKKYIAIVEKQILAATWTLKLIHKQLKNLLFSWTVQLTQCRSHSGRTRFFTFFFYCSALYLHIYPIGNIRDVVCKIILIASTTKLEPEHLEEILPRHMVWYILLQKRKILNYFSKWSVF